MHEQVIRLDDEGLYTLFCEVEAILNGCPLTEISENADDLEVLTPNHLLLLRPGEYLPPGTFQKTDNYARRRWRQIQYLANTSWSRWTKEYLPLLQARQKWTKPVPNMKVGDIVLVVDASPRNSWNMGRIIEVMNDKSGVVRITKAKTASSVLKTSTEELYYISVAFAVVTGISIVFFLIAIPFWIINKVWPQSVLDPHMRTGMCFEPVKCCSCIWHI
ncbi:hypothetical protein ScPMuIL_009558 [Solemya velum]